MTYLKEKIFTSQKGIVKLFDPNTDNRKNLKTKEN
jgi:hypothetical protein